MSKDKVYKTMKITSKGITLTISLLIPLLSLAAYSGILKAEVNNNKNKIVELKAEVKSKDIELQAQIDTKVDIIVFNTVTSQISTNLEQMRAANLREHDQIQQGLQGVGEKLDRLILRGDK